MKHYHKIQSVFLRDPITHRFIEDAWTCEEFDYLKDNEWVWTEKVDGTNIRVQWSKNNPTHITFKGKEDNAQIPPALEKTLHRKFDPIIGIFDRVFEKGEVCLYGEGYGVGINKVGKLYNSNTTAFVLFDVNIDGFWLKRNSVEDIANKLGVETVPIIEEGSLVDAIEYVRAGFHSLWGDFDAEGLVLRPKVEMFDRTGNRIITKIKTKDFERDTVRLFESLARYQESLKGSMSK